jgi:hypothetical protein
MGLYPASPTEGGIVQTASNVLGTDATTTSTSYVNLLTVTLTTVGSTRLEVYASYALSSTTDHATSQDFLRLYLDGTTELAVGGNEPWTVTESGALFVMTGFLSAGSHTIALQWHTQAGYTMRCRAATGTTEHASIVVIETRS